MTEEQIEQAEIISEEKEVNPYFLAVNKEAKLKLANEYDRLKKERQDAKNEFCNIDKTDKNIKKAVSYTHLTLPTNREV